LILESTCLLVGLVITGTLCLTVVLIALVIVVIIVIYSLKENSPHCVK